MSYNETMALLKMAKNGDMEAKNQLINQNYPLVKSVIKRFLNKGVDYDDLFQLGCVGFSKAINNFDEKYNVQFSTYAVPMIAGEVKRFLRDDGYVKVSRAIKSLTIKIKKYIEQKRSCGVEVDIMELSDYFGVEPQEIVFAMDSANYPVSLSAPVDGGDDKSTELMDRIEDVKSEQTLDHFVLKQLIENLDERERKIIIMRYYHDKTQTEIAKELGVSQVQVSRIENRVLSNFRTNFLQ